MYLSLVVLVCLALESWLDFPSPQGLSGTAVLLVLFAAFQAWLALRAWTRIGRFSSERRESFLTMVDAGLLIESPAKGLSFYLPWEGLRYRCSGNMLQFFSGGPHAQARKRLERAGEVLYNARGDELPLSIP